MNEKNMKRKFTLPGWLFVTLMAVYCELLLHFWTAQNIVPGRLVVITLFALGIGSVLGLISSLFSKAKVNKGVAIGIGVLLAVLYMTEYFLQDAYQNFMTIQTIIGGAGGVAQDYMNLIISLVTRNLWRIALVLLPIAAYGIFCSSRQTGWKLRGVLAAAAVLLYLLGFGAVKVLTNDSSVMGNTYNFDSAVRVFGLNMALALETTGSGTADGEPEFVAPAQPTMPVQETQPTQSAEETQEPTEPPVVYGYNTLDLDFAALADASGTGTVKTLHSYVASLTPSRQNEYTGLFKGKNLILITAEAFTAEVIDPELTPTLYRLANKGIKFTDYYQPAWGASTTTGEFSNLIGLVPAGGGESMWETVEQELFLTMGHQLQKLGYYSTAYHNHFHDFYSRHKTHKGLGYDRFIARGMGMDDIKAVWPESDLQMMELTVEQYIDQQPFSIYYMTVSGHCPYLTTDNAMTKKNMDKVAHLEQYSETVRGYLASQLELEYALTYLVEQLEEAGIADDTVIVLGTDHYPYGLENSSTWNNTKDYLSELYGQTASDCFVRDHNALIIWSGCIEDMGLQVDTPVYSLDILPTLSNLFGVEYDSRLLVGRDVFSDAEPLVLWPNYSWKTDKGSYNFMTDTFTPAEGVQVDDGYVEYISSIVKNKITYSRSVQDVNYFNYVVKQLNKNDE